MPLFVPAASQSGKPADASNVSSPGSVTVNEYVCVVPSSTFAAPVRCTVGPALATATTCCAVAPVSPSSSVADADTVELLGPSGKRQSNEPEVSVLLSEPDLTPLSPHEVWTARTRSWPGSETE